MIKIPLSRFPSKFSLDQARAQLTFKIKEYGKANSFIEETYFHPGETHVLLPRFYAQKKKLHSPSQDDSQLLSMRIRPELKFAAKLVETPERPQIQAFEKTLRQLKEYHGATLVLPCGTGKTHIMIALCMALGVRPLLLAHTDDLISQLSQRLLELVPGARVGIIQQDRVEVEDCDFVVASIQSIHSRDYGPKVLSCGLLVVDEAHHVAAQTYTSALSKIPHYYSLGLTATPKRGDGRGPVVHYLLGKQSFAFSPPKNNQVQVNVIVYRRPGVRQKPLIYPNGVMGTSTMITQLTRDPTRNQVLLAIIRIMHKKYPERKGLVLSDRVEHLKTLYRELDDPSISAVITGSYHTEMTKKERAASKRNREELQFNKFVTFSTYKLLEEAIDFSGSFLIFATPKPKITQPAGRIMRGRHGQPVIFDLLDPWSIFAMWGEHRGRFYQTRGYTCLRLTAGQVVGAGAKVGVATGARGDSAVRPVSAAGTSLNV